MTYDLFIGDQSFSSWSMRGWLMLRQFNLPFRCHAVGLYSGTMAADLAELAPARLVPVLRLPEGTVLGETLAMAETLAERHPERALWPEDPALRATARWLCAEMASGFAALRSACPMQLRQVVEGFAPSAAVLADLERAEALWQHARALSGEEGPWLFGAYSLADVFYAPLCARVVGYDLPLSEAGRDYCAATIADPAFEEWRQAGMAKSYDPLPYDMGLPGRPWPGPR